MSGTVTSTGFADYQQIQRVNFSTLKEMHRSPAHYRHRLDHPKPRTAAMLLGRAVHTAVLEPRLFAHEYVVRPPDVDYRTKAGKAWRSANSARDILTADEHAHCLAIRDAVTQDPYAAPYLTDGAAEQTVLWTDKETGIDCKCRIDFVDGYVVDLKTGENVHPDRFGRVVYSYDYHAQGAMYVDGYEAATGEQKPFAIIAVEKEPPYLVQVYEFADEELDMGRDRYRNWLQRVAECESRGVWPGYAEGPVRVALPRWAYDDDEDLSETGLVFGSDAAA